MIVEVDDYDVDYLVADDYDADEEEDAVSIEGSCSLEVEEDTIIDGNTIQLDKN